MSTVPIDETMQFVVIGGLVVVSAVVGIAINVLARHWLPGTLATVGMCGLILWFA